MLLLCVSALPAVAAEVDELSLDDLLNTRITTAAKFSQRLSESPSSAVVIGGDEIRTHGWRNLADALVSVPGFDLSRGADYQYLGVHGFGDPGDYNSRVLLLIDGIPSNDGIYDQALIGPEFPLDMELIDRIEVVPGPGSALYGGNAILAVVNVVTRSSDSVGRTLSVGAGSAGLAGVGATVGGRDAAGRHWLMSASAERSAGEDRFFPQWQGVAGSDGWARGLDGDRLSHLFLRYGGEAWSLQLLHGKTRKNAAGGLYATDFSSAVSNTDDTTQIGVRVRQSLAEAWSIEEQAFWGDYRWDGSDRFSGIWQADRGRSDWYGASVQLTGKPWMNQTWVMGASVRDDVRRDQQNLGGADDDPRRTASVYAQDEIRLGARLTFNMGARYDRDTLGIRQLSPREALVIQLPAATVLKLIAGRAFRPPNAFEEDYSYPNSELPGGDLKPERIASTELALEQSMAAQARWTASLYRNRFTDLLDTVTDFSTGLQQVRNIGSARTEGLELGARFRLDGGADLRGSASWQASAGPHGGPLPNCPQRLAKFLGTLPMGAYELGWESYYTGPRHDGFGAPVGGQTVSHATISGRLQRDLRWQLRVTNLFDRPLRNVVGDEYSLGPAGRVPTIADYGRQWQIRLTEAF